MLDVLFAVIFIAIPVASIVILRSAALAAILLATAIGVVGIVMQFVAITWSPFDLRGLQVWLAVALLLVLAASWLLRGHSQPHITRVGILIVGGTSAAIALAFIASRALAPGKPGLLTGVGYLIERTGAEDNAKWLNAAAHLANGTAVDPRSAIGGPLLLVMVFSATLIAVASTLLHGGVNQVAVSADTLILSEMLMVVVAPFALAPLVQMRQRWNAGPGRSTLPWPSLLLSVVILASAMALLLNVGHLTLQFTILALTLWVCVFLSGYRTAHARVLTTIVVIATAEVWFPLNVLALGLILALLAYAVHGLLTRSRPRYYGAVLGSTFVVLVLMFDFLRSSIFYALGLDGAQSGTPTAAGSGAAHAISAVSVPTLPLFSSPGGTEQITALVGAVTIAAVLGAAAVLGRGRAGFSAFLPFAPIASLGTYAILVTLADFWAIGTGPGYASKKLMFGITIPILVSALPIALMLLDRGTHGMRLMRWVGVSGVIVILVLDTFLPRALIQFKPALWPTTQGNPQPYWWPGEVRDTGDQPLTSNPIGCVFLPQGAEHPSVLQDGPRAYSCSRVLTGLAGQDIDAAGFVKWELDEWLQNTSLWDHYSAYLAQMTPETLARNVILLDDKSQVIGIESIGSLLQRYPAKPDVPASS